jgi:hypothetical protein
MIHVGTFASDAAGFAGAVAVFNPAGGDYAGPTLNVVITIAGSAKVQWKIGAGTWTTATGPSTTASVPITNLGNTLTAQGIDSLNNVFVTHSEDYYKIGHVGGGGGN